MRAVIALLFTAALAVAPTRAQDAVYGSSTMWGALVQSPSLTIRQGKAFVTIRPDGAIEYGEGYTPDAAADAFWQAVGRRKPDKECRQ